VIEGTTVVDFHGHVGRWERYGMVDDQERRLHAMDAAGVDVACVFNIFHPDGHTGNDETAAFVARQPNRFLGFAYVSPLMGRAAVAELERAVDILGFRGIKLYAPSTPYRIGDPAWDPIYAFADRRGLPVLHHTGQNAPPEDLAGVALRFPRAAFVAAHAGNTGSTRLQAIEAAHAAPNVYLETASTYRPPGDIEELADRVGTDRLLFGSDMPLMDPRSQIGRVITADLSDDAKRLILGDNARRLLQLSRR